jgi:hypothetical protein
MTVRWHLGGKLKKPWEVQVEALTRSHGRQKYGWFLEMGLGKTGCALNEFIDLEDEVDLMVVVAPQSFKLGWATAVNEYELEFLPTGYWPKNPIPFDWDTGVYAINYEAVSRSKAKDQLLKLMDNRKVMLVIDESKALGNPSSGWTKSVIELSKRATIVRELNGTPLTQSAQDYYGQLRALGEVEGWTAVEFRNRFAVLGGFMGKALMPEIRNAEELARILDRCSFRALKKDWRKDLPPKLYTTVPIELGAKQRQHYETMLEEFYVMLEDEILTADMVLTQVLKLQQISSGFMLDAGRVVPIVEPKDNAKLQAVIEMAKGPGKYIVVHHYRESGRMLIEELRKAKLNPAYIQGGMKPQEVVAQKAKFNDDPTCRTIVGQEVATALGHTLLGQAGNDRCSSTLFFENGFSLYYRSQIEDRNHRGDQDETCTCFDMIASPVEQAAVNILLKKKEMADGMDEVVAAVRSYREMVTRVASAPPRTGHAARTD